MKKHHDLILKRGLYDLMIKNIERLEGLARVIGDNKPKIEDDIVVELIRTMSDVTKLYNHQKELNG